jgi:hypothetical protein
MVWENREMLTRAVSWAGAQGIAQVIDLGCGMPAEPGIHVTARAGVPGAKVACTGNDPVVINHLTALLGKDTASASSTATRPIPAASSPGRSGKCPALKSRSGRLLVNVPASPGAAAARRAILCATDNEAHPGRNLVNSWHD